MLCGALSAASLCCLRRRDAGFKAVQQYGGHVAMCGPLLNLSAVITLARRLTASFEVITVSRTGTRRSKLIAAFVLVALSDRPDTQRSPQTLIHPPRLSLHLRDADSSETLPPSTGISHSQHRQRTTCCIPSTLPALPNTATF